LLTSGRCPGPVRGDAIDEFTGVALKEPVGHHPGVAVGARQRLSVVRQALFLYAVWRDVVRNG
jgi:hypothetical protein